MATVLQPFGGINSAVVEAFEQQKGFVLPEDYRQFLIKHNGALVEPAACFVKGPNQEVLVTTLLGLDRPRDYDLQWWLGEYRDEMPPGFLVVALGATGMFILGTGTTRGIYFWDDAHAFGGSSEEGGNTYRVAATFAEFLDALVPIR